MLARWHNGALRLEPEGEAELNALKVLWDAIKKVEPPVERGESGSGVFGPPDDDGDDWKRA